MRGVINRPYYDWGGRKYIEIESDDGSIYRAKVPFRYGRVMCHMTGLKTIQEIEQGELVEAILTKKTWDGEEFWVISSLTELC